MTMYPCRLQHSRPLLPIGGLPGPSTGFLMKFLSRHNQHWQGEAPKRHHLRCHLSESKTNMTLCQSDKSQLKWHLHCQSKSHCIQCCLCSLPSPRHKPQPCICALLSICLLENPLSRKQDPWEWSSSHSCPNRRASCSVEWAMYQGLRPWYKLLKALMRPERRRQKRSLKEQ